jgi:peptidoglycan/LPS O-acetylase OafA/YrhL
VWQFQLRVFRPLLDGTNHYLWRIPLGSADNWLAFLTYFLAGAVFYLYRNSIPYRRGILVASLLMLVVVGQLLGWMELVLPVFGTYVLFYVAFSTTIRLQDWTRRGDLSYGVYLYAFPVQQVLAHFWAPQLNPYTLTLLALPVTCGLAMLSWRFVEGPALQLARRKRQAGASDDVERRRVPVPRHASAQSPHAAGRPADA